MIADMPMRVHTHTSLSLSLLTKLAHENGAGEPLLKNLCRRKAAFRRWVPRNSDEWSSIPTKRKEPHKLGRCSFETDIAARLKKKMKSCSISKVKRGCQSVLGCPASRVGSHE
jgi:hypothetical protein